MPRIQHTLANLPLATYIASYRDRDRFLGYCRQCRNYERRWSCPPFSFDPERLLARYTHLWIIGTRIEPDDFERRPCHSQAERIERCRQLITIARQILDDDLLHLEEQFPGSLSLLPGCCFRCPEESCTRIQGQPCRHPEKLRHSLESFGFDVGRTTSDLLGIDLQWSYDEQMPPYLTLVSGLLTRDNQGPDHFPFTATPCSTPQL